MDKSFACKGDSILLRATGDHDKYLWNTGQEGKEIYVYESGTYTVQIESDLPCVDKIASATVNIEDELPLNIYSDSENPCFGTPVKLWTDAGHKSYLWSNGETTREITVDSPGIYSVEIETDEPCIKTYAEINVDFVPPVELIVSDSAFYDSELNNILCKFVEVKNTSEKSFTLYQEDLYLSINTNFSIPGTQFPITVEPNSSAEFLICFNSSNVFEQSDTLHIFKGSGCGDMIILKGKNVFEGGTRYDRCDIEIVVSTESDESSLEVFPNPAENTAIIILHGIENKKGELIIANSLGDAIDTYDFDGYSTLNLKNYESGIYIITFKGSKVLTTKLNIIK